jgi:hypothetical protein
MECPIGCVLGSRATVAGEKLWQGDWAGDDESLTALRGLRPQGAAHTQSKAETYTVEGYNNQLLSVGYRLVYEVDDQKIVVFVIAVGKRENNHVYNNARSRI